MCVWKATHGTVPLDGVLVWEKARAQHHAAGVEKEAGKAEKDKTQKEELEPPTELANL